MSESESFDDLGKCRGCGRQRGRRILFRVAMILPALVVLAWLGVVYAKSHAAAHALLAALNGEDLGGIELDFDFGHAPPGAGMLTVLQHRAGRSYAGEAAATEHRGREMSKRLRDGVNRALLEAHAHPNASLIFRTHLRDRGSPPDAALRQLDDDWTTEFMKATLTKNLVSQLDFMNSEVVQNAAKTDKKGAMMSKPGDPEPVIDRVQGPETLMFTSFECTDYAHDPEERTALAKMQLKGHFGQTMVVKGRIPMGDSVTRGGILVYPFKIEMHNIAICACQIQAYITVGHPSVIEHFNVGYVSVSMGTLEGTMYSKYEVHQRSVDWFSHPPTQVSSMETGIMNKRLAKDKPDIITVYSKQFHDQMQSSMNVKTPQSMDPD